MTKFWAYLKGDWIRSAVFAFVAVGVLVFLGWWLRIETYQGPPRTREEVDELAQPSSLVMPLTASLDEIQKGLNEQIPWTLYKIDENRDGCVPAQWFDRCIVPRPFGGCAQRLRTKVTPAIDCHVNGAARRGPIQIGGGGRDLLLTMPITASVTVRGRGEIGKRIQETADGSITARVSAAADVDENWQPSAVVNADYSWNNRIGVDVLGFRITFASKVDPKIKDAIGSLKGRLPELLAKLKLKEEANRAWSQGFSILRLAKDPDVWLRFTPRAIGYSGYKVDGRTLQLNILASGETKTFVGSKPSEPPVQPLPPLKRQLPDPGFTFVLPILAEYTTLAEAAKKALKVGETQTFDVPGVGTIKVVFKDVVIYQTTGKQLAIGISLDETARANILNTHGTVWLTGGVSVDNEKKRAKIEKLELYSQTNNAPVDILVSVVQFGPVNQAIRNALEYDFSRDYETILKQTNGALTRQISDNFYIQGRIESVSADRIIPSTDALLATLLAKGTAELRFGKFPQ